MGTWNPFRSPITVAACLLGAMAAPLLLSENAFCFAAAAKGVEYGTQCSFSITGPVLDGCDPSLIEQGQAFYDGYMEGCYKNANKRACKKIERDRHEMNVRQPQSMINMTESGYRKTKAPTHIVDLLTKFWETNKHRKVLEDWDPESIYVNHWESPSYILDVGNPEYKGGGESLKEEIWNTAVDAIAEWTGGLAKLRPVSLYGIREYTTGAVLSPHVDRIPLVSSGIVNIAQDVDEPWPLEVYGRDGLAVNITMEPGDMIFYESHSLIHGRPFPLRGRYFANVFIHFEPFDGWDKARGETELGDSNGDLPPYILPGSPEEEIFRSENTNGWSKYFVQGEEPPGNTYAAEGNLEKLKELGEGDPKFLIYEDENGWTPVRSPLPPLWWWLLFFGLVVCVSFSGRGTNDRVACCVCVFRVVLPTHESINGNRPHVVFRFL